MKVKVLNNFKFDYSIAKQFIKIVSNLENRPKM